jgi:hypothetical protein
MNHWDDGMGLLGFEIKTRHNGRKTRKKSKRDLFTS